MTQVHLRDREAVMRAHVLRPLWIGQFQFTNLAVFFVPRKMEHT